ncbi:rhomboid-like protein [Nocardia aurantia]|uniref:Rhomboid family intramembrane serine protease n=1 Tax=Nocardia aurantia TaxID=2585199 RepID=A0A7K0DK99_9NOCA|nr:rhomboid-like protein [Nocardia aurantia]MQY25214.1 hypothetical protein [Nocardia aurantia]
MAATVLTHYRSPWTRTIDVDAQLQAFRAGMRRPGRLPAVLRAGRDLLAAAPASCAYSFTLFITWWTLRGISEFAGHRLILSASTNLHNMRREPVQVLVASAFWTEGGFPWVTIAGFLTLMAFAERWLGTLRWIMVFATGHVATTLLIVTGIAYAVDHRLIPLKVAVASDVGSSYGFSSVLAALTFHLRGIPRVMWAVGLLGWYGYAAAAGRTFTDYGHLTAIAVGFVSAALAVTVSRQLERVRDRSARVTQAGSEPSGSSGKLPSGSGR